MRHMGPVTQREVHLNDSDEIVSATDTQGVITYCNDRFCEISKYSRDELMGQAHNLLRHPDMPQAAFQMMWTALKAGKPWMGIVKNRCKDGDHYWVSAYVTPLKKLVWLPATSRCGLKPQPSKLAALRPFMRELIPKKQRFRYLRVSGLSCTFPSRPHCSPS